jgi:hypothetical protein
MKHIKMRRGDEIADVAEIEIEIWQAVGFEVIYANRQALSETETQAKAEAPPVEVKRRGRPRKDAE